MTTEAALARVDAFLADWCTTSTVAGVINGRNFDLLASDLRLLLAAARAHLTPDAVERWACCGCCIFADEVAGGCDRGGAPEHDSPCPNGCATAGIPAPVTG